MHVYVCVYITLCNLIWYDFLKKCAWYFGYNILHTSLFFSACCPHVSILFPHIYYLFCGFPIYFIVLNFNFYFFWNLVFGARCVKLAFKNPHVTTLPFMN